MRKVFEIVLYVALLVNAPIVFGVKGMWLGGALVLFGLAVADIINEVRGEQ